MGHKNKIHYRLWLPISLAALSLGGTIVWGVTHRSSSHSRHELPHSENGTHPKTESHSKSGISHSESVSHSSVFHVYRDAWTSLREKVKSIQTVDEENIKLRSENIRLRLELETIRFAKRAEDGKVVTAQKEKKLSVETGAKSGRTLASLEYKPPTDLLPVQLYTLGASYFKAREDEKAAVIFTALANLTDTDEYRSAKHLLITGVAWYRVENYALADTYFSEILKRPAQEDVLPFQARARLWKALVAQKLGKRIKVQYWLRDLVDHHPRASETSWINSGEVKVRKDEE